MISEIDIIKKVYSNFNDKLKIAREKINRPLTLAEKILFNHMDSPVDENGNNLVRKKSYVNVYPDRVAMQDATAQMALLQFINSGKNKVDTPTTVHCDHLIRAHLGAKKDLQEACIEHNEVYTFLKDVSKKYGIGFWKPGAGIIHQVVLENYAFPGGLMIGTDSHTPNAGGLGMLAVGVGGADAVDVMTGMAFNLLWPGVIGVKLTGKLPDWVAPKDVILKLMSILTVKGGTKHIVEFFGDGCKAISATGKATITNMGAEHGATTSVFPFDDNMSEYLINTGRQQWASIAADYQCDLKADEEVYQNPQNFYDKVIEIDLHKLEPHWVGPHSPDLAHSASEMKNFIDERNYPNKPKYALIGSCTNSSYEDIGKSAALAKVAKEKGLSLKIPLLITPGSETVNATIKRDGFMKELQDLGAQVLANACGPCIGQWRRDDIKKDDVNTIVSSYNRNFPGRNDSNKETLSFIASPEMVMAIALSGKLSFNPLVDTVEDERGNPIKLPAPKSAALPLEKMQIDLHDFIRPNSETCDTPIEVAKDSTRLQLLKPFAKFNKETFKNLPILLKAKGKCTTDHISQAGPWLHYRGHLDKIANNTYLGAVNAFAHSPGQAFNSSTAQWQETPKVARSYKEQGINWAVIGDENFGEGSSREHAAMQPRYLGCLVIICKSFARIHETNLKKHGILPLTFAQSSDYDKIEKDDTIDIFDLEAIAPQKPIAVVLTHSDGREEKLMCNHTLSDNQINWFKAGSALNYISSISK